MKIDNKKQFALGVAVALVGFAIPSSPAPLFVLGLLVCFLGGSLIGDSFKRKTS